MKKIFGVRFDFWIVVGLFLFFLILYSLLSIVRHNHFQSQGIDFSIYDQALWLYSRFEAPYSTVTFRVDLADRFRPIMIPISTLYWFWDNERVILAFQAIVLAAAVFPIWLLAAHKLPWILALVVAFLYLDFIGIQSTAVFDFHEMAILPLFLAWLFYFLIKARWRSYFITLFLCLAVREHVGFLLSTLSIYIFWTFRNLALSLATLFISLGWSLVAIGVAMPWFGQDYYGSFVKPGDSLAAAILGYLNQPSFALENFLSPFEKIETLFWSFFSFGLVPLVNLALIPSILFQFASRFLDLQHPIRWTLFFHYSAELAVLFSVSTIYGVRVILSKLSGIKSATILLAFFLIATHLSANIILDSPLKNLLKVEFWRGQPWQQNTRLILSKVPPGASVETQNNLAPHLSHRAEIYILPIIREADYLVFDLHPGQNDWNFYTDNLEIATRQFKTIVYGGEYKPIISAGDVYLLKRRGLIY